MAPIQIIGEQRVRTSFNPSARGEVDVIKQEAAKLINLCEGLKAKDAGLALLAVLSHFVIVTGRCVTCR